MTVGSWFRPSPTPTNTRITLFCVPFAGGGAGVYNRWYGAMPAHVHLMPVQLPGREQRLREPAYDSMQPLVRDLLAACRPMLHQPWAIFGHSMGAGIAWEFAAAATREGTPPVHLFVSARRAPGTAPVHPPLFALPEAALITEVERLYGPLPQVLKDHPSVLRAFLPTMRADFRLLDTWVPTQDVLPNIPVTAYGGDVDKAVPLDSLDPWQERSTGPFQRVVLPGGHFFLREADDVRDHVAKVMQHLP